MSLLDETADVETPTDREPICIACGHWRPTCGPYCEACVEDEG